MTIIAWIEMPDMDQIEQALEDEGLSYRMIRTPKFLKQTEPYICNVSIEVNASKIETEKVLPTRNLNMWEGERLDRTTA
ncbi:hypothetical protein [Brevibacillus reuszeri]|uniref:hypothetical protein n=1 Tax=Brevibacillus reuszeri TaxID=54915 RepID=UPI000CCBFDB4|nr:hypothetical protein [Brevibacillus reuszeri]